MKSIAILDPNLGDNLELKSSLRLRFPQVQVETYTEGRIAQRIFSTEKPPIIVTELLLADDDAFWLLRQASTEFRRTTFFVHSAFPALGDVSQTFADCKNVQFLRKPHSVDLLLEGIQTVLATLPDSVLRSIKLETVLQIIQLERKTCHLELSAFGGNGHLYFEEGKIFNASYYSLQGPAALVEILSNAFEEIRLYEGRFEASHNVEESLLKPWMTQANSEDKKVPI